MGVHVMQHEWEATRMPVGLTTSAVELRQYAVRCKIYLQRQVSTNANTFSTAAKNVSDKCWARVDDLDIEVESVTMAPNGAGVELGKVFRSTDGLFIFVTTTANPPWLLTL